MSRLPASISGVLIAVVLLASATSSAWAGCSAGFCAVNTDWDAQGLWAKPGARLDLRYEYMDQDQPRHGTDDVAVGELARHHDEIRTLNRNLVAALDVNFDAHWGLSLSLPFIDREHRHIHHHDHGHGPEEIPQAWDFAELGDLRVVGRYQWRRPLSNRSHGMKFGLKLPTGDTEVINAAGAAAERSLQPGTGTTDLVLGAFYQNALGANGEWFVEAGYQRAVELHDGYRSGEELRLDLGMSHALGGNWRGLLQLNAKYRGRDAGDAAEPEDTGGRFVYVNPGVSYTLGDRYQLYGFVQLPLYEDVNGVQLTADRAATIGLSVRL